MIRTLPDLWDGCYDGEHRQKMSPQQFRETFCANCLNAGCKNSAAAGSKWLQRMLTQEDRLLDNPLFADEMDPQFRAIREQDFQDMVRHALAIEVSSRKGDWSVPTDAEIGAAAAEMIGMVPPSGFQTKPDPADPEEPQPPERLVDEVQEYDLGAEEPQPVLTVSEAGDYAHLGADRVITSPLVPDIEVEVTEAPPDPPRRLEGTWKAEVDEVQEVNMASGEVLTERWRIRGDSGTIYEVSLTESGKWDCTCPSLENPCKHARDIAQKLSRAPRETHETPDTSQQPEQPQHPTRPTGGPPSFVPRKTNTAQPTGGQMVGGGPPPPTPEEVDPWAPPPIKPKEREIPVGGRVSFGSGKKKG